MLSPINSRSTITNSFAVARLLRSAPVVSSAVLLPKPVRPAGESIRAQGEELARKMHFVENRRGELYAAVQREDEAVRCGADPQPCEKMGASKSSERRRKKGNVENRFPLLRVDKTTKRLAVGRVMFRRHRGCHLHQNFPNSPDSASRTTPQQPLRRLLLCVSSLISLLGNLHAKPSQRMRTTRRANDKPRA